MAVPTKIFVRDDAEILAKEALRQFIRKKLPMSKNEVSGITCIAKALSASALAVLLGCALFTNQVSAETAGNLNSGPEYLEARTNFLKMHSLKSWQTLDATSYQGIYVVHSNRMAPIVFNNNFKYFATLSGWQDFKTNEAMSSDELEKLRKNAVKGIPLESAIKINRGTDKFAMVIYGAVDCSACAGLEKQLIKAKGISNYMMVTSMSPANNDWAKDVWCAKNPQKAWENSMLHREVASVQDCGYPRAAIEEFANVFDVHATPMIVFADGEVVRGAPDDSASLAKLLEKIRSKVAQGIYFPNK